MTLPTIQQGSQGPDVRWAQYLLTHWILSYPDIDGIFGPKTKTAVQEAQAAFHLVTDGVVGAQTWSAIDGNLPQPPTPAAGSSGPVVEKLQTALNWGHDSFAPGPLLQVDGQFGPHTEAAVKSAQNHAAIPVDGIAGLQTWAIPIGAAGQVIASLCELTVPGIAMNKLTAEAGS